MFVIILFYLLWTNIIHKTEKILINNSFWEVKKASLYDDDNFVLKGGGEFTKCRSDLIRKYNLEIKVKNNNVRGLQYLFEEILDSANLDLIKAALLFLDTHVNESAIDFKYVDGDITRNRCCPFFSPESVNILDAIKKWKAWWNENRLYIYYQPLVMSEPIFIGSDFFNLRKKYKVEVVKMLGFYIDFEAKDAGIPTEEYRKIHPWPKEPTKSGDTY